MQNKITKIAPLGILIFSLGQYTLYPAESSANLFVGQTNSSSLARVNIQAQSDLLKILESERKFHLILSRMELKIEDRFSPIRQIGRTLDSFGQPGRLAVDRVNKDGRNSILGSFSEGGRQFLMNSPFMDWINEKKDVWASAFRGSVGNVDEENLSPFDPTFVPARERYWQETLKNQRLTYGIRPWRQNPYGYISYRLHEEGGEDLLFANLRFHYRDFEDPGVVFLISVPIDNAFIIDIGGIHWFEKGMRERNQESVTLHRSWRKGDVYLGIIPRASKIVAGISFDF